MACDNYPKNEQFLTLSFTSKDDFFMEYRRLYHERREAKELYFQVLSDLKRTISEGDFDRFKNLNRIIGYIHSTENKEILKDFNSCTDSPIKGTNLVILACKYNNVEILENLLESQVLNIGEINNILPYDKDETRHNAFYYAIRSGNADLLDTLINKWSCNHFANHLAYLDENLSIAYEELKLKNVPLSDETEIYVAKKLIDLRFFSNKSDAKIIDLYNVRKRIVLVLEIIRSLNTNDTVVDAIFLFKAKFIAKNIHALKSQLRFTYDKIPWEEIEFCLVSFISSHIKQQEINLFYNATLSKGKILYYLEIFANKLENESNKIQSVDISKFFDLPKRTREEVIVNNCPEFEKLYKDFAQIRDNYSLEKISNYVKLASSTNCNEREDQLIIIRVLHMIGEHLKNTLESPKMSNATSELLLLSLPKNTRKIIRDFRNSLSHSQSLSKRTEIEETAGYNFFHHIQIDLKKIGNVITDILYNNRIKMVRIILNKIIASQTVEEIKEVCNVFNNNKLDEIFGNFRIVELEQIEKLIEEFNIIVMDKTNAEIDLINSMNNIIQVEKNIFTNFRTDYALGFSSLQISNIVFRSMEIHINDIKGIKCLAKNILTKISPEIEPHSLREIADLSTQIFHSLKSRMQHDDLEDIKRLVYQILHAIEHLLEDIKWISKLREKLIINNHNKKKTCVSYKIGSNQLLLKLDSLKNVVLSNQELSNLTENLSSYKRNKKLQALIEILVLDIMSILDSTQKLTNNFFFLDNHSPSLIGKSFQNHVAHDNAIFEVILSDLSIGVILNAHMLTEGNIIKNEKQIGKTVEDCPYWLKRKYYQGLEILNNQERMFAACERGNLEDLKSCISRGADLNSRNLNQWTTLHFAAKGTSLEVMKFILDQNLTIHVKDINNQSPLHISAANGRKIIVEFLVNKKYFDVNDIDIRGNTPLHLAAKNGHKEIVLILIKNKADTNVKNKDGLSPLHCAVLNKSKETVETLLQEEINVDSNKTFEGFTSLHLAAEKGCSDLVIFFLLNEANVNAKTDKKITPLHLAALNGHREIVNTLILKGADVNAGNIIGGTPLHFAVENDHRKIVDALLKHKANANVAYKIGNCTPLHYAAKSGYEEIVITLLKYKANSDAKTENGIAPLHYASLYGHTGIVIALLECGVDVNTTMATDSTALHLASEKGHTETIKILLNNKADVKAKDNNHFTPLFLSAMKGQKAIVKLLLEKKAKVNVQDKNGRTPLHAAVMAGSTDVIGLLLKNKAEVMAKDHDGLTPLHFAARIHLKYATKTINLLIKNNADVNAEDKKGRTPLHVAAICDIKEAISFLIKKKADINSKANDGCTPLHYATLTGSKCAVKMLLKNRAEVNATIYDGGLTPLHVAASFSNHKKVLDILIKDKADLSFGDTSDSTQLHVAAMIPNGNDIIE